MLVVWKAWEFDFKVLVRVDPRAVDGLCGGGGAKGGEQLAVVEGPSTVLANSGMFSPEGEVCGGSAIWVAAG